MSEVAGGLTWTRNVVAQWGSWTKKHLGVTLLLSAAAFVFGWLWNTYIMAVNLEGYVVNEGEQTIATAEGQGGNSIFWVLLFSLIGGLITYGWQRGWRQLGSDLLAIPRRIGESLSHNTSAAMAMLLWGVSVSLVVATLISSAVSLALGLILLTLSATPIGVILNFALIRLWKALAGIAGPDARTGPVLLVGPFLVMVGEAFGLLLDWMIGSWWIGLILAVAAAVTSVILARTGTRPVAGTAVILFGAMLALWDMRPAWADDGGWQECMTSDGEQCSDMGLAGIIAWFGSDGAGAVMANATLGGVGAGLGAAIGVGFGSVAAGMAVSVAQAAAGGQATARGQAGAPGQSAGEQAGAGGQAAGGQAGAAGQASAGGPAGGQPGAGGQAAGGHPGQAAPWGQGADATIPQQPTQADFAQWETAAHEQPMMPGQAAPPPVEDFLPEAPDKDKKKQDDDK